MKNQIKKTLIFGLTLLATIFVCSYVGHCSWELLKNKLPQWFIVSVMFVVGYIIGSCFALFGKFLTKKLIKE